MTNKVYEALKLLALTLLLMVSDASGSIEVDYGVEEINQAVDLYEDGECEEHHFKTVFDAFRYGASLEDERSLFYLGRMYQLGHGVEQDSAVALELFNRALVRNSQFAGAWFNIGRIYEEGGNGMQKDLIKAEQAYLKSAKMHQNKHAFFRLYWMSWDRSISASHKQMRLYQKRAAELGHPVAAYSAGYHYFHGIRDAKDRKKAAYFFELAHENGHKDSAYFAGRFFERSRDGEAPDYVTAAKFYEMGTGLWDYFSFKLLAELADEPVVIEHYGEEKTEEWKRNYSKLVRDTKEQAHQDTMEAKVAFDDGRLDVARSVLSSRYKAWNGRYNGEWDEGYYRRIWWEAQTLSGRFELEWGRFLFSWMADEFFEGPKPLDQPRGVWESCRIGVRTNLSGRLISLGRFGLQRARTDEIREQILLFDGLVVEQVIDSHTVGPGYEVSSPESFPVFPADHSMRVKYKKRPANDVLCAYTVESMEPQAHAALSLGDWESALIYAAWIERWIEQIDATGRRPHYYYPGYYGDAKEMPWAFRGRVFSILGLPDRAAAEYKKSIIANLPDYGGRAFHRSNFLYAGYLVDSGRSAEVDLGNLEAIEEAMGDNRFAESHEWQFAKLVRARVLAETEGFAVGKALVDEVLAFTEQTHLPLLRLEALLVASDMCMDVGNYVFVELWLEDALKWSRGQGLLFEELRIYEEYVRYLIATGNYALAQEMQRRVLELIDGLSLLPRRDPALVQLAEIYALMGDVAQARELLDKISTKDLQDKVNSVLTILKTERQVNPNNKKIDLQPLRIVSAPLNGDCEAVYILSNPSPSSVKVVLNLVSDSFEIVSEEISKEALVFEINKGSGMKYSLEAIVPGLSQLPLSIFADGLGLLDASRSVQIQVNEDASVDGSFSEWIIETGEASANVAVIDAALIRDNPFYLVPVFHHISSKDGASSSVALRAVASEATRIECYDSNGGLIFVDAEGNGSFADPGDLIASNALFGLNPVVEVGEDNLRLEMRYLPVERKNSGRVEVRLETHTTDLNAGWTTNVVDWLER